MLTHRTVLVIADSDYGDRNYKQQLQQDRDYSYEVLTQASSHSLLPLTQTQHIDGILLEPSLPAHSIQLIRYLKEQMGDRCPPIVVVDGDNTELAVKVLKDGAADYLVKDRMTPDDLRLAMRSAIENAELRQKLQRSQEQFQTSVENMLDCFGIFSAIRDSSGTITDFRIDYLNAAACENNQMSQEEQVGRGLCELFPGHYESGLFDEYCQLVETGKPLIKDSLSYDDTYGNQRLIRAFDIRATRLKDGFVASWRDITDRKQLELQINQSVAALHQQRRKLQRLIDTAPIGIAVGSSEGTILSMNDAMLNLYGYTREEFEQGLNWHDFVPRDRVEQTRQFVEQLHQQGFLPPQETERLHADGSAIPILFSAMQWLDNVDEYVIFAINLAEQKRAEAAVQQLNRELTDRVVELQSLLDIIPVGIAIATDPSCRYMQNNAYLRELLSVSPGSNISKSAPAHEQPPYRVFRNGQEIPTEDLPMQLSARLGVDVREAEFDILLSDGRVRQLLSYTTPLRDAQNQIRGVIGAFLDITERNQDAAALKASQQRYQELAEAMPQMVWMADADGIVNYWNQRWYEYTGLGEAESMGLEGVRVVHPDDRERTLTQWGEAIATAQPFEIEYRIRHWQGEYQWFICRSIPTQDAHGQMTGWIGTITNIDDIKRSEALVQRQLAEIEAIYQSAPIGLNILDTNLRYVRINQRLAAMNGLPVDAHIGHTVQELFPNLADQLEAIVSQILATGEPLLNVEIQGETPAQPGVLRTWLEHFLPLKTEDQVVGISTVCEEITERIQVEAALRQSEERFRHMADNAPVMIWVTDPTGYCTYLNQVWYNFTGQTEETGLGFGWLDAVHPDDSEPSKNTFLEATYHQEAFRLEYRLRRQDGEYFWAIDAASPWFGEDGAFKGYIGSVIDISDRKRAEEALRRSEERYRMLFETMNEGFCVIEVLFDEHNQPFDYRFLEINPAFEQQTGLKHAEGKTAQELLPDVEQHWFEIYGDVALTGKSVRFQSGSAATNQWFDVSAFRIGSPEKHRVAILFRDTSEQQAALRERKYTEEALRESENRLRIALEATELGIWDFNPITKVLQWDDQCKAMFGLSPTAEVNYDIFLAGIHPEDRDRTHQVVLQSFNPASKGEYDIEYRTLGFEDGLERWVAAKGKTYFSDEGEATRFIGTVLNITEKKRAEAEREQLLQREQAARAEAERANRIKDEFLAVLSHELRSPLNPILGWTKLLQTRRLNETKTAEALATIERNAKVQTQLIDDLLDIARILRGKLSLKKESVNLSSVIEAAIETVRNSATDKSISLYPVLPNIGNTLGDVARLQQIVWNLLSNAIKFTPKGGSVEVRLERVKGDAQITVTDTGKGINPEFLPHIFESFRQEDASITRKYGGLGLGLAIVRQLVEAHHGTITADSSGEGLGATFRVRLPLLEQAPTVQKQALPSQVLDLTGVRIITIDDDPDARDLLTVLLTQFGAQVLSVTSASAVLENLVTFQPHALISDIGMPEVDGYQLIQQIRALPVEAGGQIPAIALTAYAREDDQQLAIASGFQRHITKPLIPEQIVQAVLALVS